MSTAGGGNSGTATILFTDLVSSTATRAEVGEHRADELRRKHDDALRAAVERHSGTVLKGLGDGIMATFPAAVDGVAAAVAAQQAIVRINQNIDGPPLAVRIGISAGDVSWEDDDVFGEPVIEASRLCAIAEGGQILASEIVRLLARSRGGHNFRPVGELELKGLPEPVAAFDVAWEPAQAEIPIPPTLRTRSPFPYVGRAAERQTLARAWKQAIADSQVAVLVAGEPGVGKTRLVAELAMQAREDGATVLAGGCDEQVNFPFQPIVEALRHFVIHCPPAELRSRLGPQPSDLTRLVPEIAELEGLEPPPPADEDTERLRVFEAVAGWLRGAGSGSPVLLVLDDLHWADTATVLLLRHLVRRNAADRVLIAGTYRDTDVDRAHPLAAALADLRREPGVERVRLRGLTVDEVTAFVASAAGHELDEPGIALARTLHDETEGNPFFLEEVLLHLIESGSIYQREDGRWTSDEASVDDLGIPEGVREVVGRRVSRLSDTCNSLLGIAAVIGPWFELSTLRSLVDDQAGMIEGIEEAERAGLLSDAPDAAGAYRFTHALVRQTLLEELSLARRQQYHLRVAEALQQSGRAKAAAVAFHYRAAGAAADPDQAVTACLIAADEARRQLAWEEASDHWEAALELLDISGDNPGRTARLLELLGDAMYATARDWQKGLDQLERAREIYDGIGDSYSAAKVRVKIGRNLSTFTDRVDIPRAFENYEAARLILGERPESISYGYLLVGFSTAHTYRAQHVEGERNATAALEIADLTRNEPLRINSELLLGWHRGFLGHADEGLALITDAHEKAIKAGLPVLAFLGAWLTTGLGMNVADFRTSCEVADREIESGRLDGAPGFRLATLQNKASLLMQSARASEALALLETLPSSLMADHLRLFAEGEWARSVEVWGAISEEASAAGNTWQLGACAFNRGSCLYLLGDLERADEQFRLAQTCAVDDNSIESLVTSAAHADVLATLGRTAEAAACADRCRDALERGGSYRGVEAQLHMAAAVVADASEAEARLRRAVEVASAYDAGMIRAFALENLARLTSDVRFIDHAIEIYERGGMGRLWIERALRVRSDL